jgi:lysyl-tRNA synthetase class 1
MKKERLDISGNEKMKMMNKKKFEFWLDNWARKVAEREKKLKRGLKIFRTESGLGASGVPHIGSFGDVLRQYGVTLALQDMGLKSELIAFCDDRDGLRKVPLGFPDWLEDYIGKPVTDIPDPFKCHKSFGGHMSSMLIESLEKVGIKFRLMSGYEIYKTGILNEQIEKILLQSALAGEIIKKILGQEKFTEMLPYLPTCENCGKIYTTRSYEVLPKEHKVMYACDLEFLGKNRNNGKDILVKGCGHKGETSYFNANGKLAWKVEFAARWCALGIVFEAHGKDILDSVRVNDEICRRILNWEPPLHFVYEMFLDKGGKKISKSIGNVLSPQIWFRYATPESLILLMLRRSEGTRKINVTDIPTYMDDVDRLEDIYFGLKEEKNPRDLFNAKRLFEFVHLLKTPKKISLHIPYNTVIEIAKILPEEKQVEFALEKLKEFGYVKKIDSSVKNELEKRLEFAKNWEGDFLKAEVIEIKVSEIEKKAIKQLIETIETEKDGEKLQYKIFEIAKTCGIKPVKFFQLIYRIIFNQDKGPRLGPYMIERGKKEIIELLEKSLE